MRYQDPNNRMLSEYDSGPFEQHAAMTHTETPEYAITPETTIRRTYPVDQLILAKNINIQSLGIENFEYATGSKRRERTIQKDAQLAKSQGSEYHLNRDRFLQSLRANHPNDLADYDDREIIFIDCRFFKPQIKPSVS